ncbi:MAG: type II toxin-antitoxin system VapC family toxin [Candidatus Omnitrophica bacterium]|nr:type II toxin-antitoxin system VapC family toxin [Candidatus Omnitrophota bacterium]MCA9423502.1 type II toxin-antitoxin system VapC family toxin [Candidatus Omnitrophota bacterium]MCA9435717.1 type II toxin-antitoxin system VapC family toxin [Candidatus Omnitrophota bacterium]MCA9442080.1 type II toxin-antitoxin system VapC family toxin [Candidatus Omnitrophota bacterium]
MSDDPRLLDTNIVSYLMRGHTLAEIYRPHFNDRILAISFITVGELYRGAEKARWGLRKRSSLEDTLEKFVVIPFDFDIARQFGKVMAERERLGRPISLHDGWIAACAMRYSIPLVTHNPKDFDSIRDLKVISEAGIE